MVCLHGGPGGTHDYLSPLTDLARFGYKVVLYDQLGCGKSEVPPDDSSYTVDYYVEELEELRKKLDLGSIHLFGHSWGGMLAIAYALKYQRNLKSLIISSGLASIPFSVAETERLVSEMPEEAQEVLKKYGESGMAESPEYRKVYQKYYRDQHSCRMKTLPKDWTYTIEHINRRIYNIMNGPDDIQITGTLKDWDVSERLAEIEVPCLITVGRYDSLTPNIAQDIHARVKGSKLVIFEESAHIAMWEEKEKYLSVVKDFLESVRHTYA